MSQGFDDLEHFDRFCLALASGMNSLSDLLAMTASPSELPFQYERVLRFAPRVRFQVAAPHAWTRLHSSLHLSINFADDFHVTITLPPHFASSQAALDLQHSSKRDNVFHLGRLRHTICIMLDMLFLRRIALIQSLVERFTFLPPVISFYGSCEDHNAEPDTVTFSRPKGIANVLMPDPFFFDTQGYVTHKVSVLASGKPWVARSPSIFWRGSTTGNSFTIDTLTANRRIAFAQHCARRSDLFDVKLTTVVQAPLDQIETITSSLSKMGLMAPWEPMTILATRKFALHIDGNSSAAGFFEKMSLGCCVLRIASRFEQWFEPRILPWVHFVPIREDLSDLEATADYLVNNLELAEQIAKAGFAFATDADYYGEAGVFATQLAKHVGYSTFRTVLMAPSQNRPATSGSWHDLEFFSDARPYRWTAGDPSWLIDPDVPEAGVLQVEIPFLQEIVPGFASACRMEVDSRHYPVTVCENCLRADIPVRPHGPILLTLRLPTLITPRSTNASSTDTRRLGLAVQAAV